MANIRINNYDRDNIVSAAMRATFDVRQAELNAAESVLARRCYEAVFPASVRAAAAKLPKNWLGTDSCLRFNVGGLDVRLDLLGDGVPVPAGRGYGCHRLGAVSEPELVTDVQAHLQAVETLKGDRERTRNALKALLYSVSSLKALRDAWPEGEQFFVGLSGKTGAPGLPAPQIQELNAMLGLTAAA